MDPIVSVATKETKAAMVDTAEIVGMAEEDSIIPGIQSYFL